MREYVSVDTTKERKIRDLFDKFAYRYDKHMKNTNHTVIQKKLLGLAIKGKYLRGKILDLGTGTGTILRIIAKLSTSYTQLFGVDLSMRMLKKAQEVKKDIRLVNANLLSLPFFDNSFDTIIMCFSFYWVLDKEKLLDEIKRVLKFKGRFVLIEEDFYSSETLPAFSKIDKTLYSLAKLEEFIGLERTYKMMKTNGFNMIFKKAERIDQRHFAELSIWKLE